MIEFRTQVTGRDVCSAAKGTPVVGISALASLNLKGAAPLDQLKEGVVSFCGAKHVEKAKDFIRSGVEALLIVPEEIAGELSDLQNEQNSSVVVAAKDSRLAFIRTLNQFALDPMDQGTSIHSSAVVHPEAKIGKNVVIGPYCVIGRSEIGDNTELKAFVSIRDRVVIGRDCLVCEHTVIGKDGFGYQQDEEGNWVQFPHFGGVVIEDGVHIGSSTCIDQGVMAPTRIGRMTRIDNLVHIAHNCQIGPNNMIVACAEISGSVSSGNNCWFGPNSSTLQGLKLGDEVFVGIRALVVENVPDKTRVTPTRDNVRPART